MSNESPLDASSFRLPDGEDIEVVLIRLDDGRIVGRTPDELKLLERKDKKTPGPEPAE